MSNTPYRGNGLADTCLLYTSDAADERSSVDLGGRRIIKKKTKYQQSGAGARHIRREQAYNRQKKLKRSKG